jgi:hypothetical protein
MSGERVRAASRPAGERARTPAVVRLRTRAELAELPALLGLDAPLPVRVVVGGAGGMSAEDLALVDAAVVGELVPAVERHGAAVVDGGTDAGVMRLLGRARAAAGAGFPLVGVAAAGTVVLPGDARTGQDGQGGQGGRGGTVQDAAGVEPNHTAVVVVPGREWGAESGWLAEVATRLGGDRPSVTVVVNGGRITYEDVEHSLARSRPVVVLAGSGRTADAIAAAAEGAGDDAQARGLAASPLVRIVPLGDPSALAAALDAALTARTAAPPSP